MSVVMQINNLSVIVGTSACNASCPYCISKMTGIKQIGVREQPIHWRNFRKACRLAQIRGVDTVMLTGKGEPTLFAHQIDAYLKELEPFNFPFIEVQTNGMHIARSWSMLEPKLAQWYTSGMTTISISVVHYEAKKNQEIYCPKQEYPDTKTLIDHLHSLGFMVRFSCTMLKGYVDSVAEVKKMIAWTKELGVEQLTLRPVVATSTKSENEEVYKYTKAHLLTLSQKKAVGKYLLDNGKVLQQSGHGATVFDVAGQNVSFSNALTIDDRGEYIRQLIFCADGKLTYDWQYEGARLL